jgi:hypothetical protein
MDVDERESDRNFEFRILLRDTEHPRGQDEEYTNESLLVLHTKSPFNGVPREWYPYRDQATPKSGGTPDKHNANHQQQDGPHDP